MKNKIITTTKSDFDQIKKNINHDETFFVEIDGRSIESERSFLETFDKAYVLRNSISGGWGYNMDALNDVMCDLDWIPQQKHILAIYSYSEMRPVMQEDLISHLEKWLHFWEVDVLTCVVGGKQKEFMVYLID